MRPRRIAWILSISLLLTTPGWAQDPTPRAPAQRTNPNAVPTDSDESRERMARDMAKKASQERHAVLKSDTDKLLKLAVELKDYVDKSNENVLSLDVVKKAEEIEKLAHSVKDKMRGPN